MTKIESSDAHHHAALPVDGGPATALASREQAAHAGGHYNDTHVQVLTTRSHDPHPQRAAHASPFWQTGRAKLRQLARGLGLGSARTPRVPESVARPGESQRLARAQLGALAATLGQPHAHSIEQRDSAQGDAIAHGQAQQERLKGKSIEPHVASRHMRYVEFDGIGRIQGFKQHDVPPHVLADLATAQTASLTQINSPHPREVAKTELDSLVQFMALLRNVPGETARALFGEGRSIWLSGNVGTARVTDYFRRAANDLRDVPGVRELAEDLSAHASREKSLPQYHENLYGRKFDSEIARALILDPPPAMLAATRAVAAALIDRLEPFLASLGDFEHLDLLDQMHRWVDEDVRPWFSHTPELHDFVADPSFARLLDALRHVDNGFDVLKVNYLVPQLSMLGRTTAAKDWMAFADINYESAVIPQRSTQEWAHEVATDGSSMAFGNTHHDSTATPARSTEETDRKATTDGYGLRLHYQPAYEVFPEFGRGKSWPDAKTPDFEHVTGHEQTALLSGHPVATGASGTANVMASMLRHLTHTDRGFDAKPAMLGAMAFLVFDGGHSFNEAMAVHEAIAAHPGAPDPDESDLGTLVERYQMMSGYSLRYDKLATFDDRSAVERALDSALSQTLDHFDAHSYFARQNREITDRLHD
ncbi:hypothetical protein [Trinickia sp.]|uniref:hypothetical protein n=1 Tax=Trinickia sp. TaxID=2571163 RepID=UPI003F7FC6F6